MDFYEKKTMAVAENVRKLSRVLNKIDAHDVSKASLGAAAMPVQSTRISNGNEWSRYLDKNTNKFYYHNNITGVTQWNPPTIELQKQNEFQVGDEGKVIVREVIERIVASICSNSSDLSVLAETNDIGTNNDTSDSWNQYFDVKSQRWYFHNSKTNTTQWERPAALKDKIQSVESLGPSMPAPLFPVRSGGSSSEDYRCVATFNQRSGKFCMGTLGPQLDDLDYWKKVLFYSLTQYARFLKWYPLLVQMGRQEDKAGRQLAAFIDLADLERNRQETARLKALQTERDKAANYEAWKKAKGVEGGKAKKRKQSWLYEP